MPKNHINIEQFLAYCTLEHLTINQTAFNLATLLTKYKELTVLDFALESPLHKTEPELLKLLWKYLKAFDPTNDLKQYTILNAATTTINIFTATRTPYLTKPYTGFKSTTYLTNYQKHELEHYGYTITPTYTSQEEYGIIIPEPNHHIWQHNTAISIEGTYIPLEPEFDITESGLEIRPLVDRTYADEFTNERQKLLDTYFPLKVQIINQLYWHPGIEHIHINQFQGIQEKEMYQDLHLSALNGKNVYLIYPTRDE